MFGLTGPNNGSDATGSIDTGTLDLDKDGKKVINIKINKDILRAQYQI